MSSIHFATGKLDAFDFFVEEVLRLFNRVHRVTVQKTVYMCRVVVALWCLLVL